MNQEQVKSLIRSLITTFGGMIAGFFAAKGWLTTDQVWAILNSPTLLAVATSLAMAIWGQFAHTKANAVAVVDAMPEVAGVVVKPTLAGDALIQSTQSPTVAPAGTTTAANLAK